MVIDMRRLAIGLLGLAFLASPVAAAQLSAKDFLMSIYAHYRGANSRGINFTSPAQMKLYFTPALGRLIHDKMAAAKLKDEVPPLDGDPFIDGQDWMITNLAISVADQSPDRSTGTASFKNQGEPKTITYDLVKTTAGWRIDDIHFPDGHGTLRGLVNGEG